MKSLQFLAVLILITLFSGCKKQERSLGLVPVATPIIKSLSDIRNSISVTGARETNADGKIYVTSKLLFYIAQESGVHIFDNTNPASPKNIAFINIEGVHDIAVKGNYLYADNYVDLLVFDISDVNNIQLRRTLPNTISFEAINPATARFQEYVQYNTEKELIVKYKVEMRVRQTNFFATASGGDPAFSENFDLSSVSTGTGGSYAKFQINNNALYTTETSNLTVFNISNPTQTFFDKKVYITTWIGNAGRFETLYKQGNFLFVGATNGMFIVDATDEFNPQFISGFSHATMCDPVVVNGTTAYVTLRGGNTCNASLEDQINVIDISDISNPTLISTYLLDQPLGLGIHNNTMYVCCGDNGLKVFDASNSSALELKRTYATDLTDVIPLDSHLIAVGKNKIVQYAYGDNNTLQPISTVNF